jgi:adenosylcobinamide amidohydrolase
MSLKSSSGLVLSEKGDWLEIEFGKTQSVLSWAVVGGGWTHAKRIIWHQIRNDELGIAIDERAFLHNRLKDRGKEKSTVGFLTSAALIDYSECWVKSANHWVWCIATVGLSNALQIGDPPLRMKPYGTINILLQVSEPLDTFASIEAVSLVAEARTFAVLEERVPSRISGLAATGTGTDCIAVASPLHKSGEFSHTYAGKHTSIGSLIGQATYEAVGEGVRKWKAKWGNQFSLSGFSNRLEV